jgi:two-component system, cell cycle response regulator
MISLPPLIDRPARVLLIQKKHALEDAVEAALVSEGYEIVRHREVRELCEHVVRHSADVVVVERSFEDEMLEAIGDLRLMDEARMVSIVIIGDDDAEEEDVVRGLLAGADDYCKGTVRLAELLARVRVQLRHRRDRDLLRMAQRERVALVDAVRTDPLTGIGNRRAADEQLERALVGNTSVLLMVIDIDRFKSINDTHGHASGDEVLRALGKALRRMARDGDEVARYGGEEFIVLIREAPPERHLAIAERFRAGVAQIALPPTAGVTQITASVGAASWTLDCPKISPQELFAAADAALYAAKRTGRDRVVHTIVRNPVSPTVSLKESRP